MHSTLQWSRPRSTTHVIGVRSYRPARSHRRSLQRRSLPAAWAARTPYRHVWAPGCTPCEPAKLQTTLGFAHRAHGTFYTLFATPRQRCDVADSSARSPRAVTRKTLSGKLRCACACICVSQLHDATLSASNHLLLVLTKLN